MNQAYRNNHILQKTELLEEQVCLIEKSSRAFSWNQLQILFAFLFLMLLSIGCTIIPVYRLSNGGARVGPINIKVLQEGKVVPVEMHSDEFFAVAREKEAYAIQIQNRTQKMLKIRVKVNGEILTLSHGKKEHTLLAQKGITISQFKKKAERSFSLNKFSGAEPALIEEAKIQIEVWSPIKLSTKQKGFTRFKTILYYNDCKGYEAIRYCPRWCLCAHQQKRLKRDALPLRGYVFRAR